MKRDRDFATSTPRQMRRADAVDVFRDPSSDGYRDRFHRGRGEHVAPAAFADLRLSVDDILARPRPYNGRRRRCAMDPETRDRLLALLKKTEADVVEDWKWPIWRREPRPDDEDRPPGPRR